MWILEAILSIEWTYLIIQQTHIWIYIIIHIFIFKHLKNTE